MNLEIFSNIFLLCAALIVLVKSADAIEDSFVFIAKKLRVSEFYLGFFVLGVLSSLPELSIAVYSARSVPELSVGNLLGATLILSTLVLGLGAIKFNGVNFKGRFRRREMYGGMLIILTSLFFLSNAKMSVLEGIVLVLMYILLVIDVRRQFNHKKLEELEVTVLPQKMKLLLSKAVVGIVFILISSTLVVESAVKIGESAGVSNALLGLLVLALGTNIPEVTLMLRSKNHDQFKLSIGNFIGSSIFNATTLGILAILSSGFVINNFIDIIPVMVIVGQVTILLVYFSWTEREINKTEGVILLGGYFSLIITEILLILF